MSLTILQTYPLIEYKDECFVNIGVNLYLSGPIKLVTDVNTFISSVPSDKQYDILFQGDEIGSVSNCQLWWRSDHVAVCGIVNYHLPDSDHNQNLFKVILPYLFMRCTNYHDCKFGKEIWYTDSFNISYISVNRD